MFINIDKISTEVNRLNLIIEKYDNLSLEMNKKIIESSMYWNSKISANFYSNAAVEKNKNDLFIGELKEYSNLYEYLIEKYSFLGNKIYYDLNREKDILSLMDKMINKYDSIIIKFDKLGIEYEDKKNKIIECKDSILNLRNSILEIYKKIQNINNDINRKINDFKIEYIKEKDILSFV